MGWVFLSPGLINLCSIWSCRLLSFGARWPRFDVSSPAYWLHGLWAVYSVSLGFSLPAHEKGVTVVPHCSWWKVKKLLLYGTWTPCYCSGFPDFCDPAPSPLKWLFPQIPSLAQCSFPHLGDLIQNHYSNFSSAKSLDADHSQVSISRYFPEFQIEIIPSISQHTSKFLLQFLEFLQSMVLLSSHTHTHTRKQESY